MYIVFMEAANTVLQMQLVILTYASLLSLLINHIGSQVLQTRLCNSSEWQFAWLHLNQLWIKVLSGDAPCVDICHPPRWSPHAVQAGNHKLE